MTIQSNETLRICNATERDSVDHQYGRRIEADRSWTVYHVFTGIPARVMGDAMTGLSRSDATAGMLCLNLRNARRRRERAGFPTFAAAGRTGAFQS